jgi:hypothetical protein
MINRCHTEVASHVFLCLLEDEERLYKEEQKSVYIDSFLRQDKILNIIRRHLSSLSLVKSFTLPPFNPVCEKDIGLRNIRVRGRSPCVIQWENIWACQEWRQPFL